MMVTFALTSACQCLFFWKKSVRLDVATVSPVNGDFSKGAHITYVKFSAGMMTPLHSHTHSYTGVVIAGVSMHWEPGKPDTKKQLSAGAHWFIPANVKHVSECLPGSECILALYQQDYMDFLPVN